MHLKKLENVKAPAAGISRKKEVSFLPVYHPLIGSEAAISRK
jgi:hypothetical protein